MSRDQLVVRFARAKRYPHPNGPRRTAGTIMPIAAELARQWAGTGVVELLEGEDLTPEVTAAPALADLKVAELRELATGEGVELGKAKTKSEIVAAIEAHRATANKAADAEPNTGVAAADSIDY